MQTETTRKLIKAVQTGKRALGMTDDEYRAMLRGVCGKESSKDMGEAELKKLLAAMRRLGFRPVYTPQMNLVRHLWIAMHEEGMVKFATDSAIDTYTKRICGSTLRESTPAQVQKIIETLKKWIARLENKAAQDRLNQVLLMEKPATVVVQ